MSIERGTGAGAAAVGSRPAAATGRGSLLGAELGRLRRRRLVVTLAVLGVVVLVGAFAVVFATHSTDLASARAAAVQEASQQNAEAQQFEAECRADPQTPPEERASACAVQKVTADDVFVDPRYVAEANLPPTALAVGVAGAMVAALIGATAMGADWSSRTIVTLLTWEPRRLRLLATRLAAVAIGAALLGVVAQALALGLGALTAQLRGAWATAEAAPGASGPGQVGPGDGGTGDGGTGDAGTAVETLIPHAHFWRDLLSLQVRGVALIVLAAVLAAAVTAITRHTAGLLGVMLVWFVVVENAVRVLADRLGWPRWLLTENVVAFLLPGGSAMATAPEVTAEGVQPGSVLVSNLDALLYLALVTAAAAIVAGALLRRRDL